MFTEGLHPPVSHLSSVILPPFVSEPNTLQQVISLQTVQSEALIRQPNVLLHRSSPPPPPLSRLHIQST
ncbi:unnamed protein product [Pleuronectes platessa]|uniref:Uncharacterized protein n=1 Tax=Pleuronectes platessa TaxID=8262 RepID=A0A9N7VE38_PLEPL|nr:unnamed protein product [Pleuronectes platessa]